MGWRTVAAVVGLPSVLLTYYFAVFVPFSMSVEEEVADSGKMEQEFLSAQQASIESETVAVPAARREERGDDGLAELVNGSKSGSSAPDARPAGEEAKESVEDLVPTTSRRPAPRTRARFVSCPACRLNKMPKAKLFLKELLPARGGYVRRADGEMVGIDWIRGEDPRFEIADKDSANVLETIPLAGMSVADIEKMLEDRAFLPVKATKDDM